MSWSPVIIIELVMVLGGALVWGWWELRSIRKDNERIRREKAQEQQKPADGQAG